MASFGARLKQERERRNITLDDVAASTKIGTRMLRALEDEHFDQLPGGIFNRGFVRAYARHLGIDENQAIADYLAVSGETLPIKKLDTITPTSVEPAPASEESFDEIRIPWGIVAIVLVIVAVGFAVWGFRSREKSTAHGTSLPPVSESANISNKAIISHPIQESAAPSQPAQLQAATPPNVSPAAAGSFVVLVKAREESWIQITADGKPIMSDILTAATEKSVEAQNNIVVKAGNAGALDIFFNGKKIPVPGDYDEVKTLTFDANGLQLLPKPPVP